MKLKKSLVSIVAVLCFVSGTVTLNGLGRFVEDEQTKIYALEKDNIGDATIAYKNIENALFPCHGKTKISQTAFENGTPPSGDEASHFFI